MSRRWGRLLAIGAVSGLMLITLRWVVETRVVQQLSRDRRAARIIGPAQLTAAREGEPAVWTIQAVVGGDEADLYLPGGASAEGSLPIALLLQGAHVDKRHYAGFAAALARQGFLVVVPNHWRTFPPLPLIGQRILLADQRQIGTALAALQALNSTGPAPLRGVIDGERLVVIGHSMGGLAGLEALADRCRFPLCIGSFQRPEALRGGVFYGTDLRGHGGGPVGPIETNDRPVALISGSRDEASSTLDVEATWEQIRTRRKALLTIEGADHDAITSNGRPENPLTTDQKATIATIARWSGLFLQAEVMEDPQAQARWRRWLRELSPPGGVRVRTGS